MRALITGGAGFIGSNIVDIFIENGIDVAVLDDLSTGFIENLNSRARFYKVDIRDAAAVAEVFDAEKPDFVDHLAAQMDVRRSTIDPVFDAEVNIIGSLNIIINSLRVGVKKIIYASTGGAVYGEPEYLPADENHPVNPICQYGISKHTVEHYLYLYRYNYGLEYTVLRYPNVYGPRQNPHGEAGVVAIFTNKIISGEAPTIFGDGSQTRDYTYVKDVANANLIALEKGNGEIINIGTGLETSVNDIFNSLNTWCKTNLTPVYARERLGEIQRVALNADKAKRVLGWKPDYTLDRGLGETVEFIKKNLK
ncbi:MAG: NAD-dependent epimerase/dehydratase family protein [Patescibacteria group bacterium]|nr:NAD-dependent epimerase/dehydratase family protein [Patescibacteria group bacterium]